MPVFLNLVQTPYSGWGGLATKAGICTSWNKQQICVTCALLWKLLQIRWRIDHYACLGISVMFTENILQRDFQNGDIIALLHGALIQSDSGGFKSPKPWFAWFSGLLEMSPTLRNPYFWLWLCRKTSNHTRQSQIISNILFGERSESRK